MTEVILNVLTNYERETLYPGNRINVEDRVAERWVNGGIAHYPDENKSIISKVDFESIKLKDYIKHERVTIIILVKDALEYFKACIESVRRFTDNYELIIVDNGSNKETKMFLENLDLDFTLITNDENKGVSYGWNQGIKVATCDYICILNSDTIVTINWLGKLMKGFNWVDNVGIVAPLGNTSSPNQRIINVQIEDSNKFDRINTFALSLPESYKLSHMAAFCWIIKKKVFDKIGVFDYKRYGLAFSEDIDYLWRIGKVGIKIVLCDGVYIHHFRAKTSSTIGNYNQLRNYSHSILHKRQQEDPNIYIENDVELGEIKIKKSKICVVTCITGRFDNLIDQSKEKDIDYIAFIDDMNMKSKIWQIKEAPKFCKDPRRNARRIKWLIHEYIDWDYYNYSLWIDGNIKIKVSPRELVKDYLGYDIVVHKHPNNKNIYQEADACIKQGLDYEDIIRRQMNRYKKEGFSHNILSETPVILRRHNEITKQFNQEIWNEIKKGSLRDQLSFDYVLWKLGIDIGRFPNFIKDSEYFIRIGHIERNKKYV